MRENLINCWLSTSSIINKLSRVIVTRLAWNCRICFPPHTKGTKVLGSNFIFSVCCSLLKSILKRGRHKGLTFSSSLTDNGTRKSTYMRCTDFLAKLTPKSTLRLPLSETLTVGLSLAWATPLVPRALPDDNAYFQFINFYFAS